MSWRDLLQPEGGEQRTLPWLGGRQLRARGGRTWRIQGKLPDEFGWYTFDVTGGRKARLAGPGEPDLDIENNTLTKRGFLVGNRLIPDDVRVDPDPTKLAQQTIQVELVEPGLEKFTRAIIAKAGDHFIFVRMGFPEGPEMEVLAAYQDRKDTVDGISGVTPALDLAFRFETRQRFLVAEQEIKRERLRLETLAKAEREAQMQEAMRQIGTAEGRRELAKHDFKAAAKAALMVSDAELLDTRDLGNGEAVVHYRFRHRRLECVVDKATLRVSDAGVCLEDHGTGERGDTRFTLESLPAVIAEAMELGKLVVWRRAPGDPGDW